MNRYLRRGDRRRWDVVPRDEPGPELVPRTEAEEARRARRDWLRDRDESNTDEFEGELQP